MPNHIAEKAPKSAEPRCQKGADDVPETHRMPKRCRKGEGNVPAVWENIPFPRWVGAAFFSRRHRKFGGNRGKFSWKFWGKFPPISRKGENRGKCISRVMHFPHFFCWYVFYITCGFNRNQTSFLLYICDESDWRYASFTEYVVRSCLTRSFFFVFHLEIRGADQAFRIRFLSGYAGLIFYFFVLLFYIIYPHQLILLKSLRNDLNQTKFGQIESKWRCHHCPSTNRRNRV